MKRNAECSLSERAIAFSVDALLSGGGKSKTARTHHEHMPDSQEYECRNKAESEYGLNSDCVFPFQEKRSDIQVELQSADLWSRFYRLGNEMIITKSGRRIFPALKVKVKGLEPKSHYIMWADILPVDNLRYRYVYHTSQWVVAGAGEEPAIRPSVYIHPDSPALGRQWQSQVVTFDKLKLTNNKNTVSKGQWSGGKSSPAGKSRKDLNSEELMVISVKKAEDSIIETAISCSRTTFMKVILHSMHKYLPRIHIQKTILPDGDPEHQIDASQSVTFSFPETEFITVTAYQNQQITRLKIASNPFAKGFREVLRTGKKGPVNADDRQKLEAVNSVSRNSSNSGITDFSSTHGIPYTGNMNIDFNHQSAFFPASTSLYRLGISPFHYSHENLRTTYSKFPFSHDNLRTTYTHFPFSPCYDVRLLTPTVGACDTYHHNEQSLFHKVSNSETVSVRDSCTFRSDSQAESTTNLVFGWRPGREETKPTARVAPCVLHDTHSHIYSQISSTASLQKGT